MIMLGLTNGSISTNSGYKPLFLAHSIPIITALTLAWSLSPNNDVSMISQIGVATLNLVYFAVQYANASNHFRLFKQSYDIREQQASLNAELKEKNAKFNIFPFLLFNPHVPKIDAISCTKRNGKRWPKNSQLYAETGAIPVSKAMIGAEMKMTTQSGAKYDQNVMAYINFCRNVMPRDNKGLSFIIISKVPPAYLKRCIAQDCISNGDNILVSTPGCRMDFQLRSVSDCRIIDV